jgi:hypothetical protein
MTTDARLGRDEIGQASRRPQGWRLCRGLLVGCAAVGLAGVAAAVDMVVDGKAVAEIVLPESAGPSAKVAAQELQRHLEAMSGAKLPIVSQATTNAANHVYVGDSEATRKLGVTIDDIKYDGFKIIAKDNYVVLAGKDTLHWSNYSSRFRDIPRFDRQKTWEEYTGHKWRFPPILDYRDDSKDFGFHLWDGTGTLYAMFELLEQLGMRFYMPIEDIGIVTPKLMTIRIKEQSLKREPQFPQRVMADIKAGQFKAEFLWYKSLRVGSSYVMPIYHSLSGPLEMYPKEQPQEYYGKVNGEISYYIPRLTNERLRKDQIEYLDWVDKAFPGSDYVCIGQPDGWSVMDSDDAAAGWDKLAERGASGRFSDYMWDFSLDLRKRIMEKQPDKKFITFAYSGTRRPPTNVDKVPTNTAIVYCQTSQGWMLPNTDLRYRDEWLPKLTSKDQLLIWEYYIVHAPNYNFPPVPIIFTKLMQQNFGGLYDHSAGFMVEVGWSSENEMTRNKLVTRRPGLMHLMLYLHGRLTWDRNLDVQAVLNEYYELFFGPAKSEMKEFYEFAESVWMRPELRQITAVGGFLKQADVDRYFDILARAKARAGDSIYGKRIDFIAAEMEPLKNLFEKLKRTGPTVEGYVPQEKPVIDGDLTKPFWRARGYTFNTLRDIVTGETPAHLGTSVSFRWLADNSALIVGIECMEPRMDRIRASCSTRDDMAIFNDDSVEIRLETAQGLRPFIVVNPAGTVYDECVTDKLEDLASFYTVKQVAVKKLSDRWTVEVCIDAKSIKGEMPTGFFPWGVHINRQRLAGNTTELYMLSPSGSNFQDMKSMANLIIRK